MSQGHAQARNYPIPMLWMEAEIATKRCNQQIASEIGLMQLAVGSVLSKKAADVLKTRLKDLTGE